MSGSQSAVDQLRDFDADKRELDPNAHAFARIDGYCSERKVWSFDVASSEGAIARWAVVDQQLRDCVSAAGGSIWYGRRGDGSTRERPADLVDDPARK